jgi:hypothetical protein
MNAAHVLLCERGQLGERIGRDIGKESAKTRDRTLRTIRQDARAAIPARGVPQ